MLQLMQLPYYLLLACTKNTLYVSANTVAFAASPNSEAYYEGLQRVAYGDIQLNLGDAFDGTVFTCPASGLYLFSVSVRGSPDHVFEV